MIRIHALLASVMIMILIGSPSVFAASNTPVCPPEIQVEQKVIGLPSEWKEADSQAQHRFVNVMFSEGEPSKQVILAPTQQKKGKRSLVNTWVLSSSASGYWLSCAYSGTSMIVSQRLPEKITSCEVEYDASFSVPVAKRVTCK
jgi:hypothetical protein